MRVFECQYCGQMLSFETVVCESCRHELGYLAERGELCALESEGPHFRAPGIKNRHWRFCDNAAFDVCNWLVDAETPARYCLA